MEIENNVFVLSIQDSGLEIENNVSCLSFQLKRKEKKKKKTIFFQFIWFSNPFIFIYISCSPKLNYSTFPLGDCKKDLIRAGVDHPSPPYILGFQLSTFRILLAASLMITYTQRHMADWDEYNSIVPRDLLSDELIKEKACLL